MIILFLRETFLLGVFISFSQALTSKSIIKRNSSRFIARDVISLQGRGLNPIAINAKKSRLTSPVTSTGLNAFFEREIYHFEENSSILDKKITAIFKKHTDYH